MLKYILTIGVVLFLGYNSIEIKPLDQVKKSNQKFDALAYARNYLTKILPVVYKNAIPISDLPSMLAYNKIKTFELSHAVSIGNIRHFLIKGEGLVSKINEDDVLLVVKKRDIMKQIYLPENLTVHLSTEFIYGSSVRDAAGLFDIKQFTNNADMNNVSAEINKIIRTEIIPPFKQKVKVGDMVQFIGALELNQEHPQLDNFEVLPIELK